MKKNLSTGRIMRLAMALLLLTIGGISTTLNAQGSDGFFRAGNDDSYSNRDEVSGVTWDDVNTQDPTQPAPVGCGLLIMTVAGAGYVVMKRKKTSGKVMLMALVMMLTFTQCKKNVETVQPTTNGINMTLYANNGAKTNINGSGEISWSTSETIYVVDDDSKQCVGTLTNGVGGGNAFSGTLEGITTSGVYNFHYYYLGKGNSEVTYPTTGAESFSMDFTNQDGSLGNLEKFHIGVGTEVGVNVTPEKPVYSYATMQSLVSIGYFDIAGMAEVGENVYMYGENLNNKITIDFTTNTVTNTKVDTDHNNNYICLGTVASGATCGKYVMLVPNHTDGTEELDTDIIFVSKRTTGTCDNTFPYGIVANNFYCNEGITSKPIDVEEVTYDEGILRGKFSISDEKQVRFSQGNLKYQASTNKWRFANQQYDFIGNALGNSLDQSGLPNPRSVQSDYIDLYMYGANGYGTCYPYLIYNDSYDQLPKSNITNTDYDWGKNNIDNGTVNGSENAWYTMSKASITYVLNNTIHRPTDRYLKAKINSICGLVLFADDYVVPCGVIYTGTNTSNTNWNECWDATTYWNVMEAAGAVFLPAAGYGATYGSTKITGTNSGSEQGHYWFGGYSTTNPKGAAYLSISSSAVSPTNTTTMNSVKSVRLVKDVE